MHIAVRIPPDMDGRYETVLLATGNVSLAKFSGKTTVRVLCIRSAQNLSEGKFLVCSPLSISLRVADGNDVVERLAGAVVEADQKIPFLAAMVVVHAAGSADFGGR